MNKSQRKWDAIEKYQYIYCYNVMLFTVYVLMLCLRMCLSVRFLSSSFFYHSPLFYFFSSLKSRRCVDRFLRVSFCYIIIVELIGMEWFISDFSFVCIIMWMEKWLQTKFSGYICVIYTHNIWLVGCGLCISYLLSIKVVHFAQHWDDGDDEDDDDDNAPR